MANNKKPMTGSSKPPTELRKIKWTCPECKQMNWSHYISCAMCGTVRKAVTAASIIFLMMSAAWGQEAPKCFPAEQLLDGLKERYHESIVGAGVSEGGNIIVITASEDGETWSAITMSPQGIACPQASGNHWHAPTNKGKPS